MEQQQNASNQRDDILKDSAFAYWLGQQGQHYWPGLSKEAQRMYKELYEAECSRESRFRGE